MIDKEDILRNVILNFERTEIKKTKDCPPEDDIWCLLQEKLDEKVRDKLISHIHDCPFCLRLFSEISIFLNPPEKEIPKEIYEAAHKAIEDAIFKKSWIQITFSFIKERYRLAVDKVVQITEKGENEIPFGPITSFASGGKEEEVQANDYTFRTDELDIFVHPEKSNVTITIDEGENYTGKRKIDEYEVVLVAEGSEPIRRKPNNGIVKFQNIKTKKFKVFIE